MKPRLLRARALELSGLGPALQLDFEGDHHCWMKLPIGGDAEHVAEELLEFVQTLREFEPLHKALT